jgi:hypothetical protein
MRTRRDSIPVQAHRPHRCLFGDRACARPRGEGARGYLYLAAFLAAARNAALKENAFVPSLLRSDWNRVSPGLRSTHEEHNGAPSPELRACRALDWPTREVQGCFRRNSLRRLPEPVAPVIPVLASGADLRGKLRI